MCLPAFMRAGLLYKCVFMCVCASGFVAAGLHRCTGPSITRHGHYTQAGVEVDNAPTVATAGASTARGVKRLVGQR